MWQHVTVLQKEHVFDNHLCAVLLRFVHEVRGRVIIEQIQRDTGYELFARGDSQFPYLHICGTRPIKLELHEQEDAHVRGEGLREGPISVSCRQILPIQGTTL
jgi:hypothetical protein